MRRFMTVMSLGCLIWAGSLPAQGSNLEGWLADSSLHTVRYAATVGPDLVGPAEDSRINSWNTIAGFSTTNQNNTAHDSTVDIYWQKAYAGTGGCPAGSVACIAVSECFDWNTGFTRCFHWHSTFNGSWTGGRSGTENKNTACHEFGHTVGLAHVNAGSTSNTFGCMNNDRSDPLVRQHNVNHVEALY